MDAPANPPAQVVPAEVPEGDEAQGKYAREGKFQLPVDANNKAKKIVIWWVSRPHMRAFHFAWSSFFLAFFGWFALAPLQSNIKNSNEWLSKGQRFKYQNIIAVAGTIFMRFLIGPVCDRFGPRLAQSTLLGVFSIPLFLVGTARNYAAWTTARFFIGFMGATFVVTQFWTSVMFAPNIVGTANATSAGWGNLGGGVTNVLMPQIRKGVARARGITTAEQIKNDDTSWRIAVVIPASLLVLVSIGLYLLSDDVPEGNYRQLHQSGQKQKTDPFKAFGRAALNWRSWVLFLLYAGCFGVELLMNSNLATYFRGSSRKDSAGVFIFNEAFKLTEGTAGLIAGLFGLMNLFARTLGGIGSDLFAYKFGFRGRLWWFFLVQFLEGVCFVGFSQIKVIGGAIPVLLLFSLFVQMSEGATFGIVPFVDPEVTGAISGIVGAGGNFGAVAGGFLIEPNKKFGISTGFRNLGFIVIASSFLVPLLHFPKYGSMFFPPSVKNTSEEAAEEATE